MNTAQRRASYSNFWLRYGYVNFYIIIMYLVIYLFIYLFGGYGPAGRERAARDADVVPPAEVASWDAARPRDADPPGEVVRREVVRPRDRDRPGKVARQDDARLRDVDTPPEISCRDVAQPRDPAPPRRCGTRGLARGSAAVVPASVKATSAAAQRQFSSGRDASANAGGDVAAAVVDAASRASGGISAGVTPCRRASVDTASVPVVVTRRRPVRPSRPHPLRREGSFRPDATRAPTPA